MKKYNSLDAYFLLEVPAEGHEEALAQGGKGRDPDCVRVVLVLLKII